MNAQLVESIYKMIQSLSDEERSLLEEKLFANLPYPSDEEINRLSAATNIYDFLNDEPDIYSLEDGEAIEWL
ncbi:MAG: hypothetical protein Tsb0014_33000 [Pleurocapsa sp.]